MSARPLEMCRGAALAALLLVALFKQLVEKADRATTFHELREAGERYGKVMGHNAARAFALLATAAIGHTAAGLAGRAAGTGTPQGQWTNNEAAARYLKDVRPGLDGPAVVRIPEGMGQVIMPDGSILPARHALVVPKANGGIDTAYPVPGPR